MTEEEKITIHGYTKEKIYELLPAIYRQHDARLGRSLEQLLSIIADQVKVVEQDIASLYDNWFIETCDEWVTAYIADLVGATSLSASKASSKSANPISQRAYIANTIGYRRRKGTLSMLEQLARDTTQWGVHIVEFFRLLDTTQNLNHIQVANHHTINIRDTVKIEYLSSPFDIAAHTVEVRNIVNGRGYYNIPNVGIFLWRLAALPSNDSHAFKTAEKNFTFNPLGYDSPIFNSPTGEQIAFNTTSSNSDIIHLSETRVPAPISINKMAENPNLYYGNDKSVYLVIKYAGESKRTSIFVRDIEVRSLADWSAPKAGKSVAIDPSLGRISLSKDATDIYVKYYYGFARKMGGGFYRREAYKEDFDENPQLCRISRRQAFIWNNVPKQTDESSHLRDILRNDFGIEWIEEDVVFDKTVDGRTITMDDNKGHSLSIALSEENKAALLYEQGIEKHTFDVREDDNGTLFVSKHNSVYLNIEEAIGRWIKDRSREAIFEIIDSESYLDPIKVNLPADCVLSIRAAQEQRPILRSLQVEGETGSKLVLEGIWMSEPTAAPELKIMPGDMNSISIRHCTLVPGSRKRTDKKYAIEIEGQIRRYLCSWDEVAPCTDDSEILANFLNQKLMLDWVNNNNANFDKEKYENGERITYSSDKYSLKIELESQKGSFYVMETRAILSIKDIESEAWKNNVYEFIIMIEDGKKNMYLKGANDNLKVSLSDSISGKINVLKSPIFSWTGLASSCVKKGINATDCTITGTNQHDPAVNGNNNDNLDLQTFLKTNFGIPRLKKEDIIHFEIQGPNKIVARLDNNHSIELDHNEVEASLYIDGKKVYDFIYQDDCVYVTSNGTVHLSGSIVDSNGSKDDKAIESHIAHIENSTIFGETRVDIMELASNSIFTGRVETTMHQQGCIRFSFVPLGSHTLPRYKCQPDQSKHSHNNGISSNNVYPSFTSMTFGQPGYAQLDRYVDTEILEGADNGAEMGAFNSVYQPQRIKDLKTALTEYLRVGLEAGIILVT